MEIKRDKIKTKRKRRRRQEQRQEHGLEVSRNQCKEGHTRNEERKV